MTLQQNKNYKAELTLGFLEAIATNDIVAKKFTDVGFKNVSITGTGAKRVATGLWPGATQQVALPKQVTKVIELN